MGSLATCVALAFLGKAVCFPEPEGWVEVDTCGPFPLSSALRWREGSPCHTWYCGILGSVYVCPWFWICLLNSLMIFLTPLLKTCIYGVSEDAHLQSVPDPFWHLHIPWCRTNWPRVCPSQLCGVGFLTKDTKLTETHTKMEWLEKNKNILQVLNQLSTFSVVARWEWLQCL